MRVRMNLMYHLKAVQAESQPGELKPREDRDQGSRNKNMRTLQWWDQDEQARRNQQSRKATMNCSIAWEGVQEVNDQETKIQEDKILSTEQAEPRTNQW